MITDLYNVFTHHVACGDAGNSMLEWTTGGWKMTFHIYMKIVMDVISVNWVERAVRWTESFSTTFQRLNWTPQAILYLKGARKNTAKIVKKCLGLCCQHERKQCCVFIQSDPARCWSAAAERTVVLHIQVFIIHSSIPCCLLALSLGCTWQ